METAVDERFDVSHITQQMVYNAAKSFTGEINQAPPIFSAKKIDGERAYEYARRGEEVIMTKRKIVITAFEITGISMPEISFRVVCSKGTYIRSLARDFGKHLNSGAYLSELCRTRIGDFLLAEAMSLEDFEKMITERVPTLRVPSV